MERYDESPEIALKTGDVIFSKDGSLGNPALIKELPDKATINGTMMLVRLHEKVTPNFFYQVLNSDSFFRLLHILKSGSSIPHIFQRDMENFKFKIPQNFSEQNKISSFLENVDEKIELLKKKQQLYQDFKKYLMQQIFAQKLRFDFTEEWDYLSVEDIFKSVSPKKYQIKSAEIKEYGDFEVIDQGQDEIAGYFNDKTKLCYELPIIIYGDHTTFVKFRDKPFIVGADGVKLLSPKINAVPKYLFYALEHFNIKPEGYKRHFSIVKKVKLPIPDLKEQNEITNIFSNVDIKIKCTQKQLNETKEFKKGLLQQMFVYFRMFILIFVRKSVALNTS